jgi:predicted transcriptional regulator
MTYCSQILETHLPTIDLHDKVSQVLQEFEHSGLACLPVLDGVQFLGIICEEDLFDFSPETEISTIQHVLLKHSVKPNDHILQALRMRSKYFLSVVPVVNEKNEWEGIIDAQKLLDAVVSMIGANDTGSFLVIEMLRTEYAPGIINRLVESNDAMIMQMNTHFDTNTGSLQVVLRINKEEISDVVATFQRYEYNVLYSYGEETYDNALQKNLDHLFNYLSI